MSKLSRRGIVSSMTLVVIGLILVAFVIAVSFLGVNKITSWLVQLINSRFAANPGPTFLASPANYDRLNQELDLLLEDQGPYSYKIIPYTIGCKYRRVGVTGVDERYILVGFNKDKNANSCIMDSTFVEPDRCNRSGGACLCLCITGKGCEQEDCQVYKDVDYFISHHPKKLHGGGIMQGVNDPITGTAARCLMLYSEDSGNRWVSKNLYVEKARSDGKVFIFMAMADEDTEKRAKDLCSEYNNQFSCALAKDRYGNKCIPYYHRVLHHFVKCDVCPGSCKLKDYVNDWLIAMDPCDCADQVEPKNSCSQYTDQFDCAVSEDRYGNKCVPYYDTLFVNTYLGCDVCPASCKLKDYVNDWLIAMDPCDCADQVEPKSSCSEYVDQFECAVGEDRYRNKCVPYYDTVGVETYRECDVCPQSCVLSDYIKDWLIAINPCDCTDTAAPSECTPVGGLCDSDGECCSGECVENPRTGIGHCG